MKKTLNEHQRAFIKYLQEHHKCLGMSGRLMTILNNNSYTDEQGKSILSKWKDLVLESTTGQKPTEYWCNVDTYGHPKKYLKT